MLAFFFVGLFFRLILLAVSIRHEKLLKQSGAIELGAANSKLLAGAHTVYYLAAFVEGVRRKAPFDGYSVAGLIIFTFSAVCLLIVVKLLGRLWTVKLLLAPDHELVRHPLFRIVRHPNYFLNLIPELIGYALVFHAFITLSIGLPLYLVPLITRIRQEERAMSDRFGYY